jgi:hypothetical protein
MVNANDVLNKDTELVPNPNRYDHPKVELKLIPGLNFVKGRPKAASRIKSMNPRKFIADMALAYMLLLPRR